MSMVSLTFTCSLLSLDASIDAMRRIQLTRQDLHLRACSLGLSTRSSRSSPA